MKIICVGRNYAKHAKELNNPLPTEPVIFTKPDSALLKNNADFYYPEITQDCHFECEIVYRISREGKHINKRFASTYIDGVGLGIDFTARDLQTKAKEKGLPWALAKGFNGSAPVSQFIDPEEFPNLGKLTFDLKVNGEVRQEGNAADMIFTLGELIEYISKYITIKKGDLIFTGTPEGVGPVQKGDHLVATLEGREMLNFKVK